MGSGNPVLDKNLQCIGVYNPKLAQEILNLPYLTSSIKLIETDLKEPNLTYNDLILHAQDGAELEAQTAFGKIKNSPLSMHIVFGIGIGYLFKEFCTRSKGLVFLFEPNLEILRVTLELVDFSKELSQKNVFVVSNIQDFKQVFAAKYKYKAEITFSFLGSYSKIYGDEMMNIFKQIEQISGSCMVDYNTLKKEGVRSVDMILDNLPYTLEGTPVAEFKDIYKGKTALIISAGPSLDSNIEIIKKNRDKFIIFCVGTAFKALANNGIKPDFVNIIEINDCSGQVKDFDLSDIDLILEPYTNTSIFKLKTKHKLLFPTNTAHANNYWAKITDTDLSPYISKGTVSYESLYTAKMMGFSKIILVGQDLAYVNNKCYSDGAAYSELAFDVNPETGKPEFKIKNHDKYIKSLLPVGADESQLWCKSFADWKVDNLNKTLFYVKGINGEMLPTQGGYATFVEHFREFARLYKDGIELINTSMIGAQIDGFENLHLEKAIENSSSVDRVELKSSYKFDVKNVLDNLNKDREILKDILKEFTKAKEYIFKFNREYHRRKIVTADANKFFKTLLAIYDKITLEYYKNNPLYQVLAFNEDIELQFVIQSIEKINMARIVWVYALLKTYFENIERKLINVINKIDEIKGVISESISAKS